MNKKGKRILIVTLIVVSAVDGVLAYLNSRKGK